MAWGQATSKVFIFIRAINQEFLPASAKRTTSFCVSTTAKEPDKFCSEAPPTAKKDELKKELGKPGRAQRQSYSNRFLASQDLIQNEASKRKGI